MKTNAVKKSFKKAVKKIVLIALLLYSVYVGSFFLIHKAKPDAELNAVLIKEFHRYLSDKKWFDDYQNVTCIFKHWKEEYDSNIKGCVYETTFFYMNNAKIFFNFLGLDFYAVSIPEVLDDRTDIAIQLKNFLASKSKKNAILFKVECSSHMGFFLKCPGKSDFCSINNYSISIF